MWVYPCFEGDDDDALAWAQHELYWGGKLAPEERIGYGGALTYWWGLVVAWAEGDRSTEPWFARNFERMRAVDGFNHKLLQIPHEHIAAYYRWSVRDTARPAWRDTDPERYRLHCIRQWREYLKKEIPALMHDRQAHLAVAKIIIYRHFDASERAAERLDEILMARYGMDCVADTWRATCPRLVATVARGNIGTSEIEEVSA